jgi:exodeoxyribonuclease V
LSYFDRIIEAIGHDPTRGQGEAAGEIEKFFLDTDPKTAFVLRGYAGTGKTTLISALVRCFSSNIVLLAPTGRAAKVLSSYSGTGAQTIHRYIYSLYRKGGVEQFVLKENIRKGTLFVVDEASMVIGDSGPEGGIFGSGNLLDDLIEFVYSGNRCRLMFCGDLAQLPPVGSPFSPALDPDWLKSRFALKVFSATLRDVVRQARDSGILTNATEIREMISSGLSAGGFQFSPGKDLHFLPYGEFSDALNTAYSRTGMEDCIVVCRSNKSANGFNRQIRFSIRNFEEEITAGDLLMVVKNNYSWLSEDSKAGFIANGDIVRIEKVKNSEEKYGLRFANIVFKFPDLPEEPEVEAKIIVSVLEAPGPALSQEIMRNLYLEVDKNYAHIKSKQARLQKVKSDPYFNALQVKFAYAVTCHKAQGGQWREVFIDRGMVRAMDPDKEYLRWLYTAVTRATERVFVLE